MQLKLIEDGDSLRLTVYVCPRAARTEVQGIHDGCLKVRLTAPALENRANRQLIEFLSKTLQVSKSDLRLAGGSHTRCKQVVVRNLKPNALLERLGYTTLKPDT